MSQPVLPGAVLGVFGGGQLGRMVAIAARQMGYRIGVFTPDDDSPASQVADFTVQAPFDDLDAIRQFALRIGVATFEFENVPSQVAEVADRYTLVRPAGNVLHIAQNRLREKSYLANLGLPVAPFRAIRTEMDLRSALHDLGVPAVLKTASSGYDGKGQRLIRSSEAATQEWQSIGPVECILEAFVDFECEFSVIAARSVTGDCRFYGPILNHHKDHILDVSLSPAGLDERVELSAIEITRSAAEALELVGVLCIEFFLSKTGDVLINELAPRPHNSGHLTIDAHIASQFEQQVRAVCGLPLGSVQQHSPAAMANLLGDLWQSGEPNWPAGLAGPAIKLHLYGKTAARPGRKMGHLTAVAETVANAERLARSARAELN